MPTQVPDWPTTREPQAVGGLDHDLVHRLDAADGPADLAGTWPEDLWQTLVDVGAPRWSLPEAFGGAGLDRASQALRYARIAEGSLTAAFILTQHDAALRRLAGAVDDGAETAARWLRA